MIIEFQTNEPEATKQALIDIFSRLALLELIYDGKQYLFAESADVISIHLTVTEHRAFKRAMEWAENTSLFENELVMKIYFMTNNDEIELLHKALKNKVSITHYYNTLLRTNSKPKIPYKEGQSLQNTFLASLEDNTISTIVLGESHSETAAQNLISNNAHLLRQMNIAVVLENVAKTHQARIDKAVNLRCMPKLFEYGVIPIELQAFARTLIEAGVPIICGESEATTTLKVEKLQDINNRLKFANYQIQKNARAQLQTKGIRKCVCLVGKQHGLSRLNMAGLVDMMPDAVYFDISETDLNKEQVLIHESPKGTYLKATVPKQFKLDAFTLQLML
ncbi:MAG: hypothetical protein AB7I18_02220 [Candidatus Berkiella sp.]